MLVKAKSDGWRERLDVVETCTVNIDQETPAFGIGIRSGSVAFSRNLTCRRQVGAYRCACGKLMGIATSWMSLEEFLIR